MILSLLFVTTLGFSQLKNEDLAVNKFKVEKVMKCRLEEPLTRVVPAMDLKTSILTAFRTGNEKLVAVYFSLNVDVSVLEKENLYSKPQAEQVLKNFFIENKPTGFNLNHEGNSSNVKYYIGTLVTAKLKYRVTINVKSTNGKEEISHLTIQKES